MLKDEVLILQAIAQVEERLMAALDDLRTALADSNMQMAQISATLGEVSTDLDDLITKLANGAPGSQEVLDATADAQALRQRLADMATSVRDIAAKHTP